MHDFDYIFDRFLNSNLSEIKFKNRDFELELKREISEKVNINEVVNIPQKPQESVKKNFEYIKSPIVGVIYLAPSPEEKNFVEVNSKVKKGDVLCILEAMKVFNELKAPSDGIIKKINYENESLVGEGDIIFEMEKC